MPLPRPFLAPLLAAGLALVGCGGGGAPPLSLSLLPRAGEESVRMFGGWAGPALVALGPSGYCTERMASRPAEGYAAFVGCGRLTGATLGAGSDAFVSLQAGGRGSAAVAGNEAALATLLATPEGGAMLSSDGNPVVTDSIEESPGLVIVRFHGRRSPDGRESAEWRAFLDLSGRLTTVSVRGFVRGGLEVEAGRGVLMATVTRLRQANTVSGGLVAEQFAG
ncbi:hypothetical protein [Wenxinia saemankumensis]|uniref:Uncharacterized protein n=1 Tax=Wenxinia saemankumensis TaxID=1447782 RepID=A0A1M6CB29_9RHOB|nr:hypothetical protein [Wenxinia saemankumensis]SHI58093.1 hypothetical protein SAMN05444417_1099 [Wenxinia saemankumensis]